MCKIKHFSYNLFSEFPICTGHNFNILGRITRDKYCNIKLLTQCGATIAAHTVFLDALLSFSAQKRTRVRGRSPEPLSFVSHNLSVHFPLIMKNLSNVRG